MQILLSQADLGCLENPTRSLLCCSACGVGQRQVKTHLLGTESPSTGPSHCRFAPAILGLLRPPSHNYSVTQADLLCTHVMLLLAGL